MFTLIPINHYNPNKQGLAKKNERHWHISVLVTNTALDTKIKSKTPDVNWLVTIVALDKKNRTN